MKKLLLTASVVTLAASLVSCGTTETTYKLGVGGMMYIYNNDNASHTEGHKVQLKVASVIFDKNDKVVDASIDEIQVPLALAEDGSLVLGSGQMVDLAPEGQSVASKKEIGDNYASMASGKWYQEVERFEAWTIGKTLEEIHAADDGTGHFTDTIEGCSINMGDGHFPTYIGALANAKEFTVKGDVAPRASVGACSTYKSGDKVEFSIAASALLDSKIAATQVDVYEPTVKALDVKGEKGETLFGFVDTTKEYTKAPTLAKVEGSLIASKKELGDEYGMTAVSSKEWYKHAEAYEAWAVGKTEEEIKAGMGNDGHAIDEDLKAGCTISVAPFTSPVVESFHNFRKAN